MVKGPETQISPIGVIPKSGIQWRWRLIRVADLSSPKGKSVNDGSDPEMCSLQYLRLDGAVQQVVRVGHGALLAKMYVVSTYGRVPAYPDDRPLLGMC